MNEREAMNKEATLFGFSTIQSYAKYRVQIKRILRRVGQQVENAETTITLLQQLGQLNMTNGKISHEDYALSCELYERATKRGLIA